MDTISGNYNFFKEGEYSTIVVHPWWKGEVKSPERKTHTIYWRVHPLFEQYTSLLAEERGKRPFKFKEEKEQRRKGCSIDKFMESGEDKNKAEYAKPHFYEKGTKNPTKWRAITNLYPFLAPLWWIFLPNHCENLNMISREDVKVAINFAYNLMKVVRGDRQGVEIDEVEDIDKAIRALEGKINGVHWGMNFGPKAGASIDHAHIQIGGIPKDTVGETDKEINILRDKYEGEDIMSELVKALRKYRDRQDRSLVVKDLDGVLIYTPFAPKVSHQVNIICEDLSNLISSTEQQRKKISEAIFLALKGLSNLKVEGEKGKLVSVGINNVNIIAKQARFDNLETQYKLNFEISPRETTFGFSELSGFFVCDKFPEDTADKLKKEIDQINYHEN